MKKKISWKDYCWRLISAFMLLFTFPDPFIQEGAAQLIDKEIKAVKTFFFFEHQQIYHVTKKVNYWRINIWTPIASAGQLVAGTLSCTVFYSIAQIDAYLTPIALFTYFYSFPNFIPLSPSFILFSLETKKKKKQTIQATFFQEHC